LRVSDAKRSSSSRPAAKPTPADPREALAQQYLARASAKLLAEEAERPRGERRRAEGRKGSEAFRFSIAPATFVHLALAVLGVTFVLEALTFSYHALHVNFTIGRVAALSTGCIVAALIGYLSVCYLGIIESTSTGETNVDSLSGDWREWFWTLPASLGMLLLSAALGWGLSFVIPVSMWLLIAVSALVTYPIFQLSSLETGTPAQPLSLPVIQSLWKHPLGWLVTYGVSLALVNVVWLVARLAWMDPPYGTMVLLGPVATLALFFYAWLLGQLAQLIGRGEGS
jgi:hypothetical protein